MMRFRWLTHLHDALQPWECGVYVNNIGSESAVRTLDAYGANYDRLARIKTKYDPDNFFHFNHNIRPRPPDQRGGWEARRLRSASRALDSFSGRSRVSSEAASSF